MNDRPDQRARVQSEPAERAFALAGRFLELGRPERALETLASTPAGARQWRLRARAYLLLDRDRDAIEAAEQAIRDGGVTPEMLDIICLASLSLRKPDRAREAIDEARRLEPGNALLAMHQAGALVVTSERRREGIELAEQALAMAPTDVDVVEARLEIARSRSA